MHVLLRRANDRARATHERKGEVLLLRRANTGYMDGWWAAPGGHVDAGEDPSAAAIRECREEVGVTIARADLVPLAAMPYRSATHQGVDFIFSSERWQGEPRIAEPHRVDALSWHNIDALPEKVVPYLALALDLGARGEWFLEYVTD